MAETRPTGEQISFRSSKTGTHVLDTYMENVEQGTRTLADMIEDIFDSTGTFRAGNFEFRFNATDSEIEFRVGNFANPNSGWTDVTSFFDIKGTFSASTTYNNFDVVTLTNKDVYIVHGLSSGQTFADEAAVIASSNTTKLVDVSEARDWASKTTGQVASTDYSAKAYAIGGTGLDSGDGSAKDWAIKTSSTVGNTGEYSAKYWATSTNVTTVANGIANINTVAGAITSVNTVASDIANVNTVAGISSDVTDVAAIDSNVTTVAANDANITTVAGVSTNVTTVAGISANVTTVAGISGNVTTVANNDTDISTVATNVADIQTVADEIDNNNLQTVANDIAAVRTAADDLNETTSEIETVANSITNVDAVGGDIANVNAVANDITNVNTSATNVANINTVAGISANVTTAAGISSNITTVAGISSDVTTAASNSSNITTVAGISANVTTVAGIASDVTTAATNVTAFNQLYLGAQGTAPTQDPDGTALDVGDLYFDTTSDTLKVYASGGWVNAGSAVNGTAGRYVYTATANQTTFSGADDASNTLAYDAGYLDVYMNGVKLRNGSSHDFTATNGTSIVLASGAAANDTIEIIAYGTFTLSNQSIDDMTDVTTSGVADGSFLEYDNANSRFAVSSTINADADGLHVSGDLDIDDTTPVIRMQESDTTDQSTMIRNVGGDFKISTLYSNGNPGLDRFIIDQATGDIKFSKSGGTGLHWDYADARLGIGTTTPDTPLEISTTGSGVTDVLKLTTTGTGTVPSIVFEGDQGGTQHTAARIRAGQEDSSNGNIIFEVEDAGSLDEAVRIMSSGNIGFSTSSPHDSGVNFTTLNVNGVKGGSLAFSRGTNSATKQWAIRTSDDEDLRFEYGSTLASEAMRIDGSNGRVGIGGVIPVRTLQVHTSGANSSYISLTNGNTGSTSSDGIVIGAASDSVAYFWNYENAAMAFATNNTERMRLSSAGKLSLHQSDEGIQIGPDVAAYTIKRDSGGLLNFNATQGTFNGYIFDTADGERLRIDSAGALQLGGTSNSGFIDFDSTSLQLNTQRNPNTGAFSNTGKSHASIIMNGPSGGSTIRFYTASGNNTTASERLRVQSGGGISFNGDTAQANALDDYEEGAWTPTIFKTSQVTGLYTIGKYTRIGRTVHLAWYVYKANVTTSGTDVWKVGNLPFANNYLALANGSYQFIPCGYLTVNGTAHNTTMSRWQANAVNQLSLYSGVSTTNCSNNAIEFSGTGTLILS